ncbi:MAG: MBL fold metallo-hydrolase [Candidatus Adiutrix sp.]|jgi:phosphoribosyl 1,2-cyclic phosphodiesterase|nr:MBL fold metallo-hydrolase [Candidatus Adiutrix sp.]
MRLKFWGVRGSIPSPNNPENDRWRLKRIFEAARGRGLDSAEELDDFLSSLPRHLLASVGANTSCVELCSGRDRLILDAGSGLRNLGLTLVRRRPFTESEFYLAIDGHVDLSAYQTSLLEGGDLRLNILLSHTHWDHIQGFPFFAPALVPGNEIAFYGRNADQLARALELQQSSPAMFPLSLAAMGAKLSFHSLPPEGRAFGSLYVRALPVPHPGGCLAYRISSAGKSLAYVTDYEFADSDSPEAAEFVNFISGVDVLISDTQYTYMEIVSRAGWGHSTSFSALDLAMRAGVKSFFLFHHDPQHSDAELLDNLDKSRAYYQMMDDQGQMKIDLAVEGLSLDF